MGCGPSAPFGVIGGPEPSGLEWNSHGTVGLSYGSGEVPAEPYLIVKTQLETSDDLCVLEADLLPEQVNDESTAYGDDDAWHAKLRDLTPVAVADRSGWTIGQDSYHVTVRIDDADWCELRFQIGGSVGIVVTRDWLTELIDLQRVSDLSPFEAARHRAFGDGRRRGPRADD
jgi:hypothetical protein